MERVDYHPGTLVWSLAPGLAHVLRDCASHSVAHDGLILATGASDRILPIPGWTLPGVFSLGGAQIALKAQGAAIGRRVVFLGSGPLLYLVAWQYMKAGVNVVAVLDTAPLSAKFRLVEGLLYAPRAVALGLQYVAALRLAGVPIRFGVANPVITGDQRVSGITWAQGNRGGHLVCDAVAFGLGLKPEAQLADLAGCTFAFSERDHVHLPMRDHAGRSSVPGVYVAGDGAGIMGADAAEAGGERAALALIEDRGIAFDVGRARQLESTLKRLSRFRDVLTAAFPFPQDWPIADETMLCRCEEITAGEARAAIAQFGIVDINRLKAVSRIGMGRCQGRLCSAAAADLVARETGQRVDAVGRLRGQAPVKPVPLSLLDRVSEAAE